jgi:hypothetical protein
LFLYKNARIFLGWPPESVRAWPAECPFMTATTLHFIKKMLFQLARALSGGG